MTKPLPCLQTSESAPQPGSESFMPWAQPLLSKAYNLVVCVPTTHFVFPEHKLTRSFFLIWKPVLPHSPPPCHKNITHLPSNLHSLCVFIQICSLIIEMSFDAPTQLSRGPSHGSHGPWTDKHVKGISTLQSSGLFTPLCLLQTVSFPWVRSVLLILTPSRLDPEPGKGYCTQNHCSLNYSMLQLNFYGQ